MAWQDDLVIMVRHLIGDLATTPVYSDDRIAEAIVVSGLIASQEYPLDVTYTFDFSLPDISPDPTLPESYDGLAIALFTLKAACILLTNSYQTAIGTGIRVRDGDSEVDTTGGLKGYSDILKNGPCAAYQSLLKSAAQKASGGLGRAVMSPYSTGLQGYGGSYFGPRDIRGFYDFWLAYY